MPGRDGPHPAALYLGTALLVWQSSQSGLAALNNGWTPSNPGLRRAARALRASLAAAGNSGPPAADIAASLLLQAEIGRRMQALTAAIAAYRRHPWRREACDPPPVWQAGTTHLRFYPPAAGAPRRAPLLLIPSLVNRHYILDLRPGRSLVRHLAGRGHPCFLIDWDRPGPAEAGFGLADYIGARLEPMLRAAAAWCKRRPVLLGYCMGGTLAVALARRNAAAIAGLALLAAPWDFAAGRPAGGWPLPRPVLEALALLPGCLPRDAIQLLFHSLDPMLVARKFLRFGALAPDSAAAAAFVAVEDWVNDGVPLAGRVARETLLGWYGAGNPASGGWLLDGAAVDPAAVAVPALAIVPDRDRLVPPASALALAQALPHCRALTVPLGHIGMVVGRRARKAVWDPLSEWLDGLA